MTPVKRPATPELLTAPKVVLHDHLDGGLRPSTLLELAGDTTGADPGDLADRLHADAACGSLAGYLGQFHHTVDVMQTVHALRTVAHEAVVDLAADGVVHAEIRFAPALHTRGGLTAAQAIDAVAAGLATAERRTGVTAGLIVCSLRGDEAATEIAHAATGALGVVAFDVAGDEDIPLSPADRAATRMALEAGLGLTIHAGETGSVDSIARALELGASRIGHGIRLVDDITETASGYRLGPVAARAHRQRTTLEVCPSSNLHTGAVAGIDGHPAVLLRKLGFNVTINTDNRLFSATSMTHEMSLAAGAWGWTPATLADVQADAASAVFGPPAFRAGLVARVRQWWNASGRPRPPGTLRALDRS